MFVCVHVFVSVHVFVCACLRVCVCLCVCVCVCVEGRGAHAQHSQGMDQDLTTMAEQARTDFQKMLAF